MISASKTASTRDNVADGVEARILDAALVRFQKVGVKKTTIEDIAREAGVDRVTVYRRMGSRDDVVQAVVNREVTAVLTDVAEIPERHDTVEDLVTDVFVTVLTRWRTTPLVERMMALEPERVIMKLTAEGATTFAMCVSATAAVLQRAVDRGLLPDAPDLLIRAELLCRIVHSLILAPYCAGEFHNDEELAAFARVYLIPLVKG